MHFAWHRLLRLPRHVIDSIIILIIIQSQFAQHLHFVFMHSHYPFECIHRIHTHCTLHSTLTNKLRDLMLGIPVPPTARQDQRAECASAEVFYEHYSHFPTCIYLYFGTRRVGGAGADDVRSAAAAPKRATAQQQQQQQHRSYSSVSLRGHARAAAAAAAQVALSRAKCTQHSLCRCLCCGRRRCQLH